MTTSKKNIATKNWSRKTTFCNSTQLAKSKRRQKCFFSAPVKFSNICSILLLNNRFMFYKPNYSSLAFTSPFDFFFKYRPSCLKLANFPVVLVFSLLV